MNTEKLEIKTANAWKAYDAADQTGKKMLENLFGTEAFSRNIMDRVKSFEDALRIVKDRLSETAIILLDYDGSDPLMLSVVNDLKIKIVAMALNEGWEPDWKNSEERKYYPWFDFSAGSGLSYDGYGHGNSSATVGSRLCYKTSDLAKYAGTQFIELYKQSYLIQK